MGPDVWGNCPWATKLRRKAEIRKPSQKKKRIENIKKRIININKKDELRTFFFLASNWRTSLCTESQSLDSGCCGRMMMMMMMIFVCVEPNPIPEYRNASSWFSWRWNNYTHANLTSPLISICFIYLLCTQKKE